LFYPLQIAEDHICVFDGKAKDPDGECERIENFIQHQGGIDVAIVGLGMNGHVGMNEPGTKPSLRSHVVDLDPVTQQVGQKYFKEQKQLIKGITLGLGTLMDAKHVILLVNGKHKAPIVQQVLKGEISEQLPASLLRRHHDLRVYLDKDAATKLQEG
jgi:6-phosphogluconolactonase/glucosamine-6-phosphate isomerase/deaminase